MPNPSKYEGHLPFKQGVTPYGLYDSEPLFQRDIVSFYDYAASQLGYPVVGVELDIANIYAAYESAVSTYAGEIYKAKIEDNYMSYEGTASSSVLNNKLTVPSLGTIIRQAKTYGSEAGSGGYVTYHSGSINLQRGKQDYNLKEWATSNNIVGPNDSIEIKRVFYEGVPASVRWLDPHVGNVDSRIVALDIMGWAPTGLPINYLLTPMSYDLARYQAIEFSDEFRKSAYSFELVNNNLRIFPVPHFETKLWFEYIKVSERDSSTNISLPDGVVTNPSNVPFTHIDYNTINQPGTQWIQDYALATVKGILGIIRTKFQSIPIPGSEVPLNGETLINMSNQEKTDLKEGLRRFLENTSKRVQMERAAAEAEYLNKALTGVPLLIYIA